MCLFYFFFYVLYGVSVKCLTLPYGKMDHLSFLFYSTLGGILICLFVVIVFRWFRYKSQITITSFKIPIEFLYIIPSGICTAIVIPTTTVLYMLPISVMVAMVIMRASIIVISRLVDGILIRQKILKKEIYPEENIAVVFALLAPTIHMLWAKNSDFIFLKSIPALFILAVYLIAYSIRIYIMNYYKNTRTSESPYNSKAFFAIEQISASFTIILFLLVALFLEQFGFIRPFIGKIISQNTPKEYSLALFSGLLFGCTAFFSVFIFIFKGRNATFSGVANRLTSLLAGTVSTIIFWICFDNSKKPSLTDWMSLIFIIIAVIFLTLAEKKRNKEKNIEVTLTAGQKLDGFVPVQT